MQFVQLVNDIIGVWKQENLLINIDEINKRVKAGSTGSEINELILEYFLILKSKNDISYQLVKNEIDKAIRQGPDN